MKETSTPQQKNIFRFIQNQRNKKSRRLRYIRNKLKPKSIASAESLLSKCPSVTLDLENSVETQLKRYYGNESLSTMGPIEYYPDPLNFIVEERGDVYYERRLLFIKRIDSARPGIADLDTYIHFLTLLISNKYLTQRLIKTNIDDLNKIVESITIWLGEHEASEDELTDKQKQLKLEARRILSKLLMFPFRRLKLVLRIHHDKCDMKLAKDLKESFVQDAILVVGDRSAPNTKFHEPTRNKGLLRFLKKAGFAVHHIDEYKTSTCCPFCLDGELEKFKKVHNPRPFVLCNGLLR